LREKKQIQEKKRGFLEKEQNYFAQKSERNLKQATPGKKGTKTTSGQL